MHTRLVARLFAVLPLLAFMSMLLLTSTVALAFTPSNFISFTLEGCRNDGSIILPINGNFICPDAPYTTGNLGKGWNELDLVPHRLTTSAGNQSGVTTDYSVYVAADYQTSGKIGYDVISAPTVNAAKSDASCTVSAGPQSTQGSAASPFGGGTDVVIYRELTIHQAAGTTCVFDYYQRLALGAHLYPGSSLQSYMFDQAGLSGSKKTISIPVNEILPQKLSKDMSATQGTDSIWDITKLPSPAKVSFGNTCDSTQSLSNGVKIAVTWTKLAATPSGPITVITHVYATNPAARVITTNVTDVIYSGTTQLDSATSGPIDVPANTANYLMLTHTFPAPSGTTNLNDIATATYTDKVTGIPVPGTTTATASATVQLTGPALNQSAVINDVESIAGAGLSYSADSFTPNIGAFDGGYVAGTKTTGSVSWTSNSQTGSGSVTFNKTIYVNGGSSTSGTLSDTANLTGSDGFTTSTSAAVDISADARVSLTINKSVAPALTSGSQTFTFHVVNSSNVEVATPTITFNTGDTNKSVTVGNLAPGSYTVSEDAVTGWITDSPKSATINLPNCSGSVSFSNTHIFSPTISTTPNPTTATVGAVLNDSANLSGGYNPTGNIVFNLYGPNDATCAGPALYNQTVAVSGASASTSPGFTTKLAGTYRWTASYSGDTYNKPVASGCQDEQVTVNKATPTLTTSASGPVTVGQAINDVATLGGGYNPTGSITFDVFAPGDTTCSTATNVPPAKTVNGAGNYTSGSYTTTAVGTYLWIAHYSGDANNNAVNTACNDANESSTVNKASPSIATLASPTSGTVGVALTVSDKATLSNGYNPSGSVVFTLYSDNQCTVAAGVSGSGTIGSGSATFSTSWTPTAAGTYYWIASYAGDANNNGFTTKCGDANEQIVIGKASPSITTLASPTTGTVGVALTVGDAATLSNGYNPSGSVVFTLYSDNKCTVAAGVSGSGTISGGKASFSTSWTPTAAGTYYWIASYAGDGNNNGFTGKCGDANEQIVISKAPPSIVTAATNATGASTTVTDKATLSGGYNPTGSITFKLYGPSATPVCSNLVFTSSPVAVNGNGTYGPVSFSPTAVGTYYWIASYSGDANNNSVTGACGDTNETSVVSPGRAKVIKTVGGVAPTGTQVFTFQLREGASTSSDGKIDEQVDASSANGWTINFTTLLVPGQHYQVCEWVYPGWNTSLGPNLFVPNSIIPPNLPNPNVVNLTVCTDFVAQAGQTTTFTVDNTPPPGGRALTIGFWKNWASCNNSNGKQKPILDQTLAVATGMTTNPPGGLVVSAQNPGGGWPNFGSPYYLTLKGNTATPNVAPDCTIAVNLLNKSTATSGTKMASDPLFNMAAQLVGAQLNYFAGAGKNGATTVNIQNAVLLLGKYQFNGNTYSPKLTTADASRANCLATQLDNYNNDRSVSACP
jgi:hypothetical protein